MFSLFRMAREHRLDVRVVATVIATRCLYLCDIAVDGPSESWISSRLSSRVDVADDVDAVVGGVAVSPV